jgi:anaerobic selenocysteine-containing dehydrogenase
VDLTGALKVNTKEDMTENSRMIVVWGANIARARTVMNVIITEKLYEAAFVRSHTIGSEEPSQHALPFILRWERSEETLKQLRSSRLPGQTPNAASHDPPRRQLHAQGCHVWRTACAMSCLLGLTGDFGLPKGVLGPHHDAQSAGPGT